MPIVKNVSASNHRYPLWGTGQTLVWGPGEEKDVDASIAEHVCRAHPDKMRLVVLEPQEPGEPEEPEESRAAEAKAETIPDTVNRQQRGGSRRTK